MTIEEKIKTIEEHDNTIITKVIHGYIVETEDETLMLKDEKTLESWIDYQFENDPAYYGLNLREWYNACADITCGKAAWKYGLDYIGFRIFDDISGKDITFELDNEDWKLAKVDAITTARDDIRVYVNF